MWKNMILIFTFISFFAGWVSIYLICHWQPISKRRFDFAYAPYWDETSQSLFFIDFTTNAECLFRYHYPTNRLFGARIDLGYTLPAFMVPFEHDNLFAVGIDKKIMIIQWDTISPVAKFIQNYTSFEQNDNSTGSDRGKADPHGRLIAATYTIDFCPTTAHSNVYLVGRNHNVKTLLSDIKSLAGLTFDTKRNVAYFVDYCDNYIRGYDYDPHTGRFLGWPRNVFNFPKFQNARYTPFGLDIDSCGKIYTALYNESSIIKIDPETGLMERMIHLPIDSVSGVLFGGNDFVMFILSTSKITDYSLTEAENTRPAAKSPLAGQVLMVKGLGVKGAGAAKRLKNF